MDSDGDAQVPSNVTRFARAISPEGRDEEGNPITQIIYYNNGVGTGDSSVWNKYVGGATGEGLAEHIRETYQFICTNYRDGDEIFLVGFSRGAFTARSISSFINAVGLLTRQGLSSFIPIFEDWELRNASVDEQYVGRLVEQELTRPGINIKAVAVWDTVGGLGIPMIGLLPQPPSKEFAFVDTKVESNIEYAFQALALDEHRRAYSPTVWEQPEGTTKLKELKQCWFPGVHSDVGGSYADTDLANLTLTWMVSQLDPHLTINHDYIITQIRLSKESHQRKHQRVPSWGLGLLHNSMKGFFLLGGSRTRTPMQYRQQELAGQHGTLVWMFFEIVDKVKSFLHVPKADQMPMLVGTNETVHSSARIRMNHDRTGYHNRGKYDPPALSGWVAEGVATNPETPIAQNLPGETGWFTHVLWKKDVKNKTGQTETLQMREDVLGGFEQQVLQLWPEIADNFDSTRPGHHPVEVRKASTFNAGPDIYGRGPSSGREVSAGQRDGLRIVANGLGNDGIKKPERVETV